MQASQGIKKLGLIAGNGKFPVLFAREAKRQNYHVVAAGVQGDTFWGLRFLAPQFCLFSVGQLQKLFEYFKQNHVDQVVMAGQVNPANLFQEGVEFDERFQGLFQALKDRKADTIFSAVADHLAKEGMTLLDSTFLMQRYLAPKGTLTRHGPTLQELDDIEFGRQIAKAMGGLDVGQTVVVKNKAIVAIEAMEGTDRTILRGGEIAVNGAVIIKMSKPLQDLRFDVPVIGPQTIRTMQKVRARCLAIESGKTIIIDRETCLRIANQNRICIIAA